MNEAWRKFATLAVGMSEVGFGALAVGCVLFGLTARILRARREDWEPPFLMMVWAWILAVAVVILVCGALLLGEQS